ncbi:MAG TPA: hypothetical protein VEB86_15510, partial [Chryseosolibacter sp.]|nr:hypothetical protein [Chryseosolibacter sp.]
MNKPRAQFQLTGKIMLTLLAFLVFAQCSEEDSLLTGTETYNDTEISATSTASTSGCAECTYVVPSSAYTITVDGAKLGLKPGAVICLKAGNSYKNINFKNLIGTADQPITITNCGGTATLQATGLPYTMKTEYSKHIRISGGSGSAYGIKLAGGHMGLSLEKLTTNVEVNNLEISNVGFAGIMAKTDPTCDNATIRGNFVMRNVILHDNYIHDTGGEGFYIGHSFFEKGVTLSCGVRYPHLIDGLRIYNNRVVRPGWDGIQVGCTLTGAYVYNNTIENYGYRKEMYQDNGIQISEGTKGIVYGNLIKSGA